MLLLCYQNLPTCKTKETHSLPLFCIYQIKITQFFSCKQTTKEKVSIAAGKNSQQPVNSNQQTDILGRQAHSGQDQKHGHQSGTGNTGCSNTGQGGCQTGNSATQPPVTPLHLWELPSLLCNCRKASLNSCGQTASILAVLWRRGPLGPSQMKCG